MHCVYGSVDLSEGVVGCFCPLFRTDMCMGLLMICMDVMYLCMYALESSREGGYGACDHDRMKGGHLLKILGDHSFNLFAASAVKQGVTPRLQKIIACIQANLP